MPPWLQHLQLVLHVGRSPGIQIAHPVLTEHPLCTEVGGGDCARPPGETSSQHAALQTPPLPALVCTARQIANHRNKEYFKGAGILMVQLYHFTGEGAEVHRGRVLSRVPLSNKSQSWERGHVSNPSSQFFFSRYGSHCLCPVKQKSVDASPASSSLQEGSR